MLITSLISRYMELCKAAFLFCGGTKSNKSIQSNIMEMLFLLMVMSDNKQILQRITNVLVAGSAFSKKPFIDNMLGIGFNVVRRLRRDAAL